MEARNLAERPELVPDFKIRSGALSARRDIRLREAKIAQKLGGWPLEPISAGATAAAWLTAALGLRYSGGRPGYRIIADELGDWRGFTRREIEEDGAPRREVSEASLIVRELTGHRYWGEDVAERVRATNSAITELEEREAQSLGRDWLLREETRRYQQWAQLVVDYLRDRIGADRQFEFEATPETGTPLLDRVESKTRLLSAWIGEFRAIANQR